MRHFPLFINPKFFLILLVVTTQFACNGIDKINKIDRLEKIAEDNSRKYYQYYNRVHNDSIFTLFSPKFYKGLSVDEFSEKMKERINRLGYIDSVTLYKTDYC